MNLVVKAVGEGKSVGTTNDSPQPEQEELDFERVITAVLQEEQVEFGRLLSLIMTKEYPVGSQRQEEVIEVKDQKGRKMTHASLRLIFDLLTATAPIPELPQDKWITLVQHFLLAFREACPDHDPLWLAHAMQERAKLGDFVASKVIQILDQWIRTFWIYDFDTNRELCTEITLWMSTPLQTTSDDVKNRWKTCTNSFDKLSKLSFRGKANPPSEPFRWGFTDLSVVARWIDVVDCIHWGEICPWDCIHADKLKLLSDYFVNVSKAVNYHVFNAPTLRDCCYRISRFISLAQSLMDMHNLNVGVTIVAELQGTEISALKLAWKLLSQSEKKYFSDIQAISSPQGRYKTVNNVSTLLNSWTNKRCVPFVPYFKGLVETFKEVKLIDKTKNNLLSITNFFARAKIFQKVSDFQVYSNTKKKPVQRKNFSKDFFGVISPEDIKVKLAELNNPLTQLCVAAATGDYEIVYLLLESIGEIPTATDNRHRADITILKLEDLNSPTQNVLHTAISKNHPEIVELLLSHRKSKDVIDVTKKDVNGKNILELACDSDAPNVLTILLSSPKVVTAKLPFPKTSNFPRIKHLITSLSTASSKKSLHMKYWQFKEWPFLRNKKDLQELRIRPHSVVKVPLEYSASGPASTKSSAGAKLAALLEAERDYISKMSWIFWNILYLAEQYMHWEKSTIPDYDKFVQRFAQIIGIHLEFVAVLEKVSTYSTLMVFVGDGIMEQFTIWYKAYIDVAIPDNPKDSKLSKFFENKFESTVLCRLQEWSPDKHFPTNFMEIVNLPVKRAQEISEFWKSIPDGTVSSFKSLWKYIYDYANGEDEISKNEKVLEQLRQKVSGNDRTFLSPPHRKLTKYCSFKDKKQMHLFLFTDFLVITDKDQKKFIHTIPLSALANAMTVTAVDVHIKIPESKVDITITLGSELMKEWTASIQKNIKQGTLDFGAPPIKQKLFHFCSVENIEQFNKEFEHHLKQTPDASVDDFSDNGNTLLFTAVNFQKFGMVKLLVETYKADVNKKTESGSMSTPLHQAAWRGNLEICKYLVEKGADLYALNEYGETPLDNSLKFQDVTDYLTEKLSPGGCASAVDDNNNNNNNNNTDNNTYNNTGDNDTPTVTMLTSTITTTVTMTTSSTPSITTSTPTVPPPARPSTPVPVTAKLQRNNTTPAPILADPAPILQRNSTSATLVPKSDSSKPMPNLPNATEPAALPSLTIEFSPITPQETSLTPSIDELFVSCTNDFVQKNPTVPPLQVFQTWENNLKLIAETKIRTQYSQQYLQRITDSQLESYTQLFQPKIKKFIQDTINVFKNSQKSNNSLLYWASSWGRKEIVLWLLERGANVAVIQDHGSTPLHVASYRKNFGICKTLVEHGAPIDGPKNNAQERPLEGLEESQIAELRRIQEAKKAAQQHS